MGPISRTPPAQAAGPLGRVIVQIVVAGIAVLSRAIPAAYQQALQNARKGGVDAKSAESAGMFARKVISRSEAMQVLNVSEEQIAKDPEVVKKVRLEYIRPSDSPLAPAVGRRSDAVSLSARRNGRPCAHDIARLVLRIYSFA